MTKCKFRMLLIDDDLEMNAKLQRLLAGTRTEASGIEVYAEVDRVDVVTERSPDGTDTWRISDGTLERINVLSRCPQYNLVLADFGFADDEAKQFLRRASGEKPVTKEFSRGRILTLLDLRQQYEAFVARRESTGAVYRSIFHHADRVIMRSLASDEMLPTLGPVRKARLPEVKNAFPGTATSDVLALDTRELFFGEDRFYKLYCGLEKHREFYHHLFGSLAVPIVESEMLRYAVGLSQRHRVRRSLFNIAVFAGSVGVLGVAVQFLGGTGLTLLGKGRWPGWLLIAAGFVLLLAGSWALAIGFERFSRAVVRWVGHEDDF